jgi:hypothetical protein
VVGDGYAMGVTAQIAEYMLRPSERWFRVDYPVLSEQWPQPGSYHLMRIPDMDYEIRCKAARALHEVALKILGIKR